MINQLRQLVSRYVSGNIGYEPFRRELVSRFLGESDADAQVEALYNSLEGVCAAHDHGLIAESVLKGELRKLVPTLVVLTLSGDIFNGVEFGVNVYRGSVVRATRNIQANSLTPYTAGNTAPFLDDSEIEEAYA